MTEKKENYKTCMKFDFIVIFFVLLAKEKIKENSYKRLCKFYWIEHVRGGKKLLVVFNNEPTE